MPDPSRGFYFNLSFFFLGLSLEEKALNKVIFLISKDKVLCSF